MTIFDGNAFAQKKEAELKLRVESLRSQGTSLKIAAVLFEEDKGSQLYTRLKSEAAQRLGIGYEVESFSMLASTADVIAKIQELNTDATVTGIIIQKPWRQRWEEVAGPAATMDPASARSFSDWWHELVSQIDQHKDVDGLHPQTLRAIEEGNWRKNHRVMPATAKAVLDILNVAQLQPTQKIIILGKSDLLGKPLYFELKNTGHTVEMIGTRELQQRFVSGQQLHDADVVISATGHANLITGEMVKTGAIVIDVGEPKPDVDFDSVAPKASFITPVPGGVGPVTVISLMENCVELMG